MEFTFHVTRAYGMLLHTADTQPSATAARNATAMFDSNVTAHFVFPPQFCLDGLPLPAEVLCFICVFCRDFEHLSSTPSS